MSEGGRQGEGGWGGRVRNERGRKRGTGEGGGGHLAREERGRGGVGGVAKRDREEEREGAQGRGHLSKAPLTLLRLEVRRDGE